MAEEHEQQEGNEKEPLPGASDPEALAEEQSKSAKANDPCPTDNPDDSDGDGIEELDHSRLQ